MEIFLHISNIFTNFEAWIGRSCKSSDKGMLIALPCFKFISNNIIKYQRMLSFEELPEINSERWLSLEDLPDEIWKPVVGYEKFYSISNYGRLKSLPRWQNHKTGGMWRKAKIRRVSLDGYGYVRYLMTGENRFQKGVFAAQIVAKAFIPNPENKPHVDHINTIRHDNRVENLRWVTDFENVHNPLTEEKLKRHIESRIGVPLSPERRKKISEALKNGKSSRFRMRGGNHPEARSIVQLSLDGLFIREWSSITEANECHKGHIHDCCRNNRKTAGGYKWMYKEDYLKAKKALWI